MPKNVNNSPHPSPVPKTEVSSNNQIHSKYWGSVFKKWPLLDRQFGEMRRCWGRVAKAEIYFGNGKINLLYTPLILTLERLRWEGHCKFEASLGHKASPRQPGLHSEFKVNVGYIVRPSALPITPNPFLNRIFGDCWSMWKQIPSSVHCVFGWCRCITYLTLLGNKFQCASGWGWGDPV